MTEREMLDRLHSAVAHAAPSDVDSVLARCGEQKGILDMTQATQKNHKTFRAAPWLAAACLTLVVAGGGVGIYQQAYAVQSTVSLDVNPSVELKLNQKEKVLSARALNSDGEKILEGMDLKGTDVEVAVNALVGSLLKNGYVDELANSILISVEDPNADRGAALQQEISAEVETILDAASVQAAILTQTVQDDAALQAKANEYGISLGKAQLIAAMVAGSDHLTFEDLAGLSVNELNLLATNPKNALPDTVQASGKASDSAYIGAEAAKKAAYQHAGVSAGQAQWTEIDFDYENGVMVYEVEFTANGVEYDYDVNAATGAIVKYSSEGGQASGGVNQNQGNAQSGKDIGAEAAKAAALKHAGLSESKVTLLRTEREWDDGVLEYQVDFVCGGVEYDYEIDGATGAVRSAEQERLDMDDADDADDADDDDGPAPNAAGYIGAEKAKAAALKHAGVAGANAYDVSVDSELDEKVPCYEVDFKCGDLEYEYSIDASTGAVLSHHSEQDN